MLSALRRPLSHQLRVSVGLRAVAGSQAVAVHQLQYAGQAHSFRSLGFPSIGARNISSSVWARAPPASGAASSAAKDGRQLVQIDSFKDITAAAKRFVLRVHPDIMHAHGADAVATNEAALQEVFIMLDALRGRSEAPDGPVAGFGASIVQPQYNLNFFVKLEGSSGKSSASKAPAPAGLRQVTVTLQTPAGLVERMSLLATRGMKEKAGAAFIELARRSVQTLLDSAEVPMQLALSPRLAPLVSKRGMGERAGNEEEDGDGSGKRASSDGSDGTSAAAGDGGGGGRDDSPFPGEDPADTAERLAKAAARKALAREAALMADAPSLMDAHLRTTSPLTQGKRESAAELAAAGYSWLDFQPKRSRNSKRRPAEAPPSAGREADDADIGDSSRTSHDDAAAGLFGDTEQLLKQALGEEEEEAADEQVTDLDQGHSRGSRRSGKAAESKSRLTAAQRRLQGRISDAEALGLTRLADRLRAEAAAQASTSSVFTQKQRRERAMRILARLDSVLEAAGDETSVVGSSASSGAGRAGGKAAPSALGGVAVAEAVNQLITCLTDHHDVLQLYEDAWLTVKFALGPPGSSFYADGPGRTMYLPVDYSAPAFVAFARDRFVPALIAAARDQVRGAAEKERSRIRAAERERNKAHAAANGAAAGMGTAGAAGSRFAGGEAGLHRRAGGGFGAFAGPGAGAGFAGAPGNGAFAGFGAEPAPHRTPAAAVAAEEASASLDELLLRSWAAGGSKLR